MKAANLSAVIVSLLFFINLDKLFWSHEMKNLASMLLLIFIIQSIIKLVD